MTVRSISAWNSGAVTSVRPATGVSVMVMGTPCVSDGVVATASVGVRQLDFGLLNQRAEEALMWR